MNQLDQKQTITVIDWTSALPHRPDTGPRVVRQPIAHETAIVPLWQPTAEHNRPKTKSTGSGIVWAALIVTFGPFALALTFAAIVLIGLFTQGFMDGFTASQAQKQNLSSEPQRPGASNAARNRTVVDQNRPSRP